jgi:radical SAM superfamily enzyme YgiQ (UPF0313 family)
MKSHPVVLITLNDYDNLGVGYLAAVLLKEGFEVKVINARKKKYNILKILKTFDSFVVGFSVIFLNNIKKFSELINYLRKGGIKCHFTAGGHYASLKYSELFEIIPQLDSIVMFEGEYTLLELVKCIQSGSDWKKTNGIIFKDENKIIINPLRKVEQDLDKFPFPLRSNIKTYAFKKRFTTILAGRGCVNNCSFCNTREFYRRASGPIKRIRKPEMVVREMEYLYREKRCSVFLFHDDDFPIKTTSGLNWVSSFCNEIEQNGLNGKIMWKINCRPDEINEESFLIMKKNGLFLVFLGIEDGTDPGLSALNKNMSVEECLNGIHILRKLEIEFDFGFMLFQPSTTFRSLNENLAFLRQICGDGYAPLTFNRLLPSYGTRVEKELLNSGRLKYNYGDNDYDFFDEAMDQYYEYVMNCFNEWLRDPHGIENISKWARNYFSVYNHYYNTTPESKKSHKRINKYISESNLFLIDTMKELAKIFESNQYKKNISLLGNRRQEIKVKHDFYKYRLINTMADFLEKVG